MAFFTAAGRLRRRHYWLRIVGLYGVGIAVYAFPGLLYAAEIPSLLTTGAIVGLLLVFYLVVVQALLRLHDLERISG